MSKIQTFLLNNRTFILLFSATLIVYGLTFYKRQADYRYWLENSQEYVVDQVTAMSGMDAYYWLKMARELDKGTLGKGEGHPLKGYPDKVKFAIKDTPSLLARFISFTRNFTGGDYYRAGILLVSILAGLFVFPLFFYFNRLGFGAAAIMGGLVGSFSQAHYIRTMAARLDTDLLNIFFPLAASCFILPISRDKSRRANILLAMAAGLTIYLFNLWYQTPAFIFVYLFILALYLLLGRVHWQQIVIILPVFLLFCGPEYVLQIMGSFRLFLRAYVSPPPTGLIAWPNILDTVTEAQKLGIETKLLRLHGFFPMVVAGFAGLVVLYLRRFRQMIPITPLIILGLWSLTGPVRFLMYLAPFIGIGIGVLIELLISFAAPKVRRLSIPVPLISVSCMFIIFFATSAHTKFYHHPRPIISAQTTRAILDIKGIVPPHSAMFTPFWEYGYPLMEIGDFATYHDGGLQGGMRTTLIAKALISPRQSDMVSFLSYLEDYGFRHLNSVIRKEKLPADKMMELVFDYSGEFMGENVYILYLLDPIWKMYSLSHFGTWDFERKKSNRMDYVELFCKSLVNNIMTCNDGTIDLEQGLMNDGTTDIPINAALFVNDGYVVNRQDYRTDAGYYLQVLMKNGKVYMILVATNRLFKTNFNQQFLLGNYDRRYFEEVYNNYPLARVLKVKNRAEKTKKPDE